jgi:hypothetical protein
MVIRIHKIDNRVNSLVLTERDWRPGDPPITAFVWTPESVICGVYVCRSNTKETGHPLSSGAINDVARIVMGFSGFKVTCVMVRHGDGEIMFQTSGEDVFACRKKAADWLNHRKLVPMSFHLLQHAFDITRPEFDRVLALVKGVSKCE